MILFSESLLDRIDSRGDDDDHSVTEQMDLVDIHAHKPEDQHARTGTDSAVGTEESSEEVGMGGGPGLQGGGYGRHGWAPA